MHPGQSKLQDRGRKGVADKSAFNYEAYRLYSADQVLGSIQKSTGPCFFKHDGRQQLAQGIHVQGAVKTDTSGYVWKCYAVTHTPKLHSAAFHLALS